MKFDEGSFRDPAGKIFYHKNDFFQDGIEHHKYFFLITDVKSIE